MNVKVKQDLFRVQVEVQHRVSSVHQAIINPGKLENYALEETNCRGKGTAFGEEKGGEYADRRNA